MYRRVRNRSAARLMALLLVVVGLMIPKDLSAQQTSTTLAATDATTSTEISKAANSDSTHTIVLLGEKVDLKPAEPTEGEFPDMVAIAVATLGGTVNDLTTPGLTIARTAELAKTAVTDKPDIAIVFAGYTDEKKDIDDAEQRASLDAMVKALKSKNQAMRIFLVPAATTVGALTAANLRLVAGDLSATYVPLGTEVSGQPYAEAFEAVKLELAAGSTAAVEETGESEQLYDQKKTSLQHELSRIAGQADGATPIFPDSEDLLTTSSFLSDAGGTGIEGMAYPEGGTLTKHGAEAHESINMRPLPAIKAYRPHIPVPRNNIETKEPALSRQ